MAANLNSKLPEFLKENPKADLAIMAQHFKVSTNRIYTVIERLASDPESGVFSEFGLSAKRQRCRVYSLKGYEAPEGYVPPYVGTQAKVARVKTATPEPKEKIKKAKTAKISSPKPAPPIAHPASASDPLESVHASIEQFAIKVGTLIGEQVAKKVSEVVMERFAENLTSISEEMASKLSSSITSSVSQGHARASGTQSYEFKKPVVLIHGLPQSQQKIISEQFKDHLEIHYPGHVNLAEQIVNRRPKESIVMVDMIGADVVRGLKLSGVIYNGLKGSMTNLQKHLQESLITHN